MAEEITMEKTKKKKLPYCPKERTLFISDWSHLPEELLNIISNNLEDCFDVIHARSVCRQWRTSFPFPSSLLRPSYSLPAFADFSFETNGLCTLEKIPMFLIRAPASASFFLGDIGRDNSEDQIELPSPLQCSVKVRIPGSELTSVNILDCQILPLGFRYRMIGWDYSPRATKPYQGVACLPLGAEGGEFVVIINYTKVFLVLKSTEMRWKLLKRPSSATCADLITFRGKFYATFVCGDIFVIDPYSLESTPLMPPQDLRGCSYLVPCGDDELYLVNTAIPDIDDILYFNRLACRVFKLDDEEAGEWVEVIDLGDLVLLIGDLGNCSCSGKDLPDGCGVSGNSVLFTNWPGGFTYVHKYGIAAEYPEDDLNTWRYAKEFCLTILHNTARFTALRVEAEPLPTLASSVGSS